MKLVLAEKPSVAQSIAKVLDATKREDGYLEGNGYVVSWCVGHLVELSQPEAYNEKYNKWAYADLPIFPEQWKYQVSASTKKQFGILKKLMARKDVESLVCATDAGREGELIFRLVYHQCECCRFIQNNNRGIFEDCPRNRNPLFFAARQPLSGITGRGIISSPSSMTVPSSFPS